MLQRLAARPLRLVLRSSRLHGSMASVQRYNAPVFPAANRKSLCPLQVRRFSSVEIKTPDFGAESITEGTLMEWQKKVGDFCAKGEILAVIETDKVSTEVKAPDNGVLEKIVAQADETVQKDQLLAVLKPGGEPPPKAAKGPEVAPASPAAAPAAPAAAPAAVPAAPAAAPAAAPKAAPPPKAAPKPSGKAGPPVEGWWMGSWRKHWYP
ncbi:kgd2 [Symbiodinium necroappetens]|uniref:Kgd2 protein n=1 Tax=Symbiodinium necroappetens TaxID=1628268 RepID=A0A812RQ29_9DINO|nr:kgd2 [Symbiodinium necroappetens]